MSALRLLPLLLLPAALLLGLTPPSDAAPPEPAEQQISAAEREHILGRFEHAKHDKALKRAGLSCSSCHQVGGAAPVAVNPELLDQAFLSPPAAGCHFCHQSDDSPVKAPTRCQSCHQSAMAPADHGAGWLELHGAEARMGVTACEDCHRQAECVDCHERKEGLRFTVHDRSWLSVHGIAARTNPAECSTCHLQVDCVDCHSDPGRAP